MDVRSLYRQMASYDRWKSELRSQLVDFEHWFTSHRITSAEAQHCLKNSQRLLERNNFTLACVGEFSRGKTELINALLFSEYGQRLLPSQPGRTTMCPTEIFYNPRADRCSVRLLPIETRRTATSLERFKRVPEKWVSIYFDPRNPKQVHEAIAQISATKLVSEREALEMGFDKSTLERSNQENDKIEIPTWRHALVNLDHALLRQGLRIIDTPGLNALGNEPELTLNVLPKANAVIFLLSADAGVSASDMAIWNEHIEVLRRSRGMSVLVLLNKIDALWVDINSQEEVAKSIRRVREATARQLKLPIEHVVPISAKEGLLAKATQDKPRLLRSSMLKLEMLLAERIVENQKAMVNHRLISDTVTIVNNTYRTLHRRTEECKRELTALETSSTVAAQQETLGKMRRNVKLAHTNYHKQSLALKSSQRLLERQRESLIAPVSSALLEQLISNTMDRLKKSWTTVGLSTTIAEFFDILEKNFDNMAREAEQANRVLVDIYKRRDKNQSDSDIAKRHFFNVGPFQEQLALIQRQSHQFRISLDTVFLSKKSYTERFIRSMVREIRNLYSDLDDEITHWIMEALSPLSHQNLYQKQLLERHMMRLASLTNESKNIDSQLEELKKNVRIQEHALTELSSILSNINSCTPSRVTRPHNVVSLDAARKAAIGN